MISARRLTLTLAAIAACVVAHDPLYDDDVMNYDVSDDNSTAVEDFEVSEFNPDDVDVFGTDRRKCRECRSGCVRKRGGDWDECLSWGQRKCERKARKDRDIYWCDRDDDDSDDSDDNGGNGNRRQCRECSTGCVYSHGNRWDQCLDYTKRECQKKARNDDDYVWCDRDDGGNNNRKCRECSSGCVYSHGNRWDQCLDYNQRKCERKGSDYHWCDGNDGGNNRRKCRECSSGCVYSHGNKWDTCVDYNQRKCERKGNDYHWCGGDNDGGNDRRKCRECDHGCVYSHDNKWDQCLDYNRRECERKGRDYHYCN